MTSWSSISVALITLNAADVIDGALASIPAEAEVIVADGASVDETRERARRRGAKVVEQAADEVQAAGGNFDVARNGAVSHASRPWLLFLDADERLSATLVEEIAHLDLTFAPTAFDMPRTNLYWGRPGRLLGEDRQLRLVRAGRGRWSGSVLHAPMQVSGTVGHLAGPLVHENVRSWRDITRRFRRDVPINARGRLPLGVGATVRLGLHTLRYYYVTNEAYRDGLRGLLMSLVYACYQAASLWRARRTEPATCSTAR